MKKILVPGGAGYIGSQMVAFLQANGYIPIVLDNLSTGYAESIPEGTKFYQGNKGDKELLAAIFSENEIYAVIDFAADSLAGESMKIPGKYFENNIGNTIALIDAMVKHGCLRYIFSSTAAVYGNPVSTPIKEDDPKEPINPYGESKLTVERLLRWYDEAHDLKWTALRYFNVGGADSSGERGEAHNPESHLIPIVIQVVLGQRPFVSINGTDYDTPDGTCIRDYIDIRDLVRAHLLALEKLVATNQSKIYNLGTEKGASVREIVQSVAQLASRTITYITSANEATGCEDKLFVMEVDRRGGDPDVLIASSERAKGELGWTPEHSITGTIESALKWHLDNPNRYKQI